MTPDQSHQQALEDLKLRHTMRHVNFINKKGWDKWREVYDVRHFKDQIGRDKWYELTGDIKAILNSNVE